jgi:hypothetical protein
MQLTEDEIMRLGNAASNVLGDDDFNALLEHFEKEIKHQIVNTSHHQQSIREELFQVFSGMREFAGRLDMLVEVRNQIINKSINPDADEGV